MALLIRPRTIKHVDMCPENIIGVYIHLNTDSQTLPLFSVIRLRLNVLDGSIKKGVRLMVSVSPDVATSAPSYQNVCNQCLSKNIGHLFHLDYEIWS